MLNLIGNKLESQKNKEFQSTVQVMEHEKREA